MDNLTHSLFGLTLAHAPIGRVGPSGTVALLLASNVPDLDIVSAAGGAAAYLEWHRGPSHGPIGIVGLSFATAAVVSLGQRWWTTTPTSSRAPLLQLWRLSLLGVLCHVLMDLPTSYGTRLLSPFVWTWFAEDWMPIIDVYLLAILGGGVVFVRMNARHWPGTASYRSAIVLGLALAYYAVRATAHQQAVTQAASAFGIQLPGRCKDAVGQGEWIAHWPRASALSPLDHAAERCLVEIAAVPSFLSPFKWRLIAQLSNAYEVADLDLLRGTRAAVDGRPLARRYSNQWTPAVVHAARAPIARTFLGFSRFPAVRSTLDADGHVTVHWSDMRFAMNPPGGQRGPQGNPFAATIRVAPDGRVIAQRLGP